MASKMQPLAGMEIINGVEIKVNAVIDANNPTQVQVIWPDGHDSLVAADQFGEFTQQVNRTFAQAADELDDLRYGGQLAGSR
jgi:hypothetical protein